MGTIDTKRLRQKILDLAVHGKLVSQDPNDESANELMKRVHMKKLEMLNNGKLKASDVNNDTIISYGSDGLPYERHVDSSGDTKCISEEISFIPPKGWCWTRVHTLMASLSTGPFGSALHKSDYVDNGIPIINPANIHHGLITRDKQISADTRDRLSSYVLHTGDFVIGRRGEMGRAAVIGDRQDGWVCGTGCFFARSTHDASPLYLNLLFSSLLFKEQLENNAIGTTLKNLNLRILGQALIPLPPLAEQQRIVAALDKYFSLVDTIERDSEALDSLVPQLKSKVLDLAIHGCLTEQSPDDGLASALLDHIRSERRNLVNQGKLRFPTGGESVIFTGPDGRHYEKRIDRRGHESVPGCIDDEIPFDIPDSWEWARLGSISDYGYAPSINADKIPDGSWSLDLEDIEKNTGRVISKVSSSTRKPTSAKRPFHIGQLLYGKLRPYLNKVLIADEDGYCSTEIMPIELFGGIDPHYVRRFLMSDYFLQYAALASHGVKMPRLGTPEGRKALIPIPPLAEQHRIAEKVDTTFQLID